MKSGREILGTIDHTIQQVRHHVQHLGSGLTQYDEQRAALYKEQSDAYHGLADIRLELIEQGDVLGKLTRTDRQAQDLLAERVEQMRHLDEQLANNEQEQYALEDQRAVLINAYEQHAETVTQAEGATHERLAQDDAWLAQQQQYDTASGIAQRARDKTTLASEDATEKNQPYHNDALFMYLWNRHYGTPSYRSNPLFKMLDGWVASIIRYEDARINYTMLNDIPKKLDEHAIRTETHADEELAALEALEQEAFQRDGVLLLQNELLAQEQDIAALDEQLEHAEDAFRAIQQQQDTYAAQEDKLYQQAITLLSDMFKHTDMRRLLADARHTATPDDNQIVELLREIEDDLEDIAEDIQEQHHTLRKSQQRLEELQGLRRRFKQQRYDDYFAMFKNEDMIDMLTQQLMAGGLSGKTMIRKLSKLYVRLPRQNSRHFNRRRSGFSFPRSRGGWSIPSGGWGGGGSRRSGGGGFKTGGGF